MRNQSRSSLLQRSKYFLEVVANASSSDWWRNEMMQSCTSSGKSLNDNGIIDSIFSVNLRFSCEIIALNFRYRFNGEQDLAPSSNQDFGIKKVKERNYCKFSFNCLDFSPTKRDKALNIKPILNSKHIICLFVFRSKHTIFVTN